MNDLRPGAIALLGGGGLLFLGTLLKWGGEQTGVSLDARGLQGLFCLIIGAGVVAVVAMANFGGKTISVGFAGLDTNELIMTLGLAAFMITFGFQFISDSQVGVLLGWIGAAAIVVGSYLERGESTAATPPTPF